LAGLSGSALATPVPLVRVTSDTEPGVYSLSAVLDSDRSITRLEYRENRRLIHSFTLDEAKLGNGYVLMREQGLVAVVSLIVSEDFDPREGGRVTLRILRRFEPFNSTYKRMRLQVRAEDSGFAVFSDLPDGLKRFDHIHFEALRKGDPDPNGTTPGTANPDSGAVGVKFVRIEHQGSWVDTINTRELR
jgi:hypothetical protein